MKVLCTGGAGFIASNLVQTLVKRGNQVTVLDDFSAGKLSNLESVIDRVNVVRGSVTDLELLRKLTSETDIIFHLAVQCLMVCNENPILAHEVNDKGTFNVCQVAKEENNKLIYISSSEIYGTCQYSPMDEKHPTNPQSIYGLTKLVGEQYVQLFNKIYGVPAVIIRPFNVYGKFHREDNYAAVITAFIKQLEHGEPPIVEGTGEQSRDFTYVSDTVNGIILLSNLSHGEIVNIGNGKSTTIKDLATALMNIYGMDTSRLRYAPARPNDVLKLEADCSLAYTHGYKPKISLEEGLRLYVDWTRKHRYIEHVIDRLKGEL